jgi:hypothetical protein
MTAYTLEQAKSSNSSTRGHYGHSSTPSGITLHHWGSTGQEHDNVVAWLRGAAGGTDNTQTSAHYVMSDGLVTQLVDDSRAAWHAGSTTGNGATIGIECRPEMSAGDWDTLVQLCTDLEEKHGSLKYYGHKDWKNTACPGDYYDRIGELVDAVNAEHKRRKNGGSTPAPSKPSEPSKPKDDDKLDVDGKWGSDTTREIQKLLGTPVDGTVSFQPVAYKADNPGLLSGWEWTQHPRSSNVIEALQQKLGVSDDGRIGPDTIKALQDKLGTGVDGKVSNPSPMVKALQTNLNAGKLW